MQKLTCKQLNFDVLKINILNVIDIHVCPSPFKSPKLHVNVYTTIYILNPLISGFFFSFLSSLREWCLTVYDNLQLNSFL